MSRSKGVAGKAIDIDMADIFSYRYRYRIDIGKGDINPTLVARMTHTGLGVSDSSIILLWYYMFVILTALSRK